MAFLSHKQKAGAEPKESAVERFDTKRKKLADEEKNAKKAKQQTTLDRLKAARAAKATALSSDNDAEGASEVGALSTNSTSLSMEQEAPAKEFFATAKARPRGKGVEKKRPCPEFLKVFKVINY